MYDLLTTINSFPELAQFLDPFISAGPAGVNPNLTCCDDPNLPWNTTGETVYAITQVDPMEAVSSTISLNKKMLQQSAPVLISSVMVHEMLHAYFNTITAFSRYGIVADNAKPVLERLSNFAKVSSGDNGRDHLTILSEYIGTIADVESRSDGAKRSKEDYYKIAISTLYYDGNIMMEKHHHLIS